MASIDAALVPIILLVALTLQGCDFNGFPPAVKLAIGHQCHDKMTKIKDANALKKVEAVKACNKLDEDKLKEYKVNNCDEVVHDMLHFALGAGCEQEVGTEVTEACAPDKFAAKGAPCKAAVDTAVAKYKGELPPEEEAEKDGAEAMVALVKHCSAAVTTAVASDGVQKTNADICDKVNKKEMAIMKVEAGHCKEYLKQQMFEMGTVMCVLGAIGRDDAPEPGTAPSIAWIEKAAKEFGEAMTAAKNPEDSIEESVEETERLRLFQAMRQMKWPGKLRRWSPASVMAAWVASGLALVALLGVAWRRRSTRQPAPQDKPILDDELQLAE